MNLIANAVLAAALTLTIMIGAGIANLAAIIIDEPRRSCAISWTDIAEYDVLARLCADPNVRREMARAHDRDVRARIASGDRF